MTTTLTTKNDVKRLASNIENLAKQMQVALDGNGGDVLTIANELTRNNLTFVFTLGEFSALQQAGNSKSVKTTTVKHSTAWHNVRDRHGRFAKKV